MAHSNQARRERMTERGGPVAGGAGARRGGAPPHPHPHPHPQPRHQHRLGLGLGGAVSCEAVDATGAAAARDATPGLQGGGRAAARGA
eukprot:2081722-Rhodomonas_salina.1